MHINQLAHMKRPKYREDEAKVKSLTKAVEETEWNLNVQQRIPIEQSFQMVTHFTHR